MDSGTTQALCCALNEAHQNIQTETFNMTIGDMANFYQTGLITLPNKHENNPGWGTEQKTIAIEKILLGLPTPQITALNHPNESWKIIGGAQWVSTVLQFQGILGRSFSLKGARILKGAEGIRWGEETSGARVADRFLSAEQCQYFMETRISVSVVGIYDYPDIYEWYQQDMLGTGN